MKSSAYIFVTTLILFALQTCNVSKTNYETNGFWQGPHPFDQNKKFYIHTQSHNDTLCAHGYWTENNFYSSEFEVENLYFDNDSIKFFIPNWNCTYLGKLSDSQTINGGFLCDGEGFDTVNLKRDDEAQKYLTEAKPNCRNKNYSYKYSVPLKDKYSIPSEHFKIANDSIFIYSIIPEIIANKYGRLNSFLIIKDGKLICEEYFYGYSKDDLHQIESSTKSITSLLIGIANDKGFINSLVEPVFNIFPQYPHLKKDDYQLITINNLLTMTSGYYPEYEPYKTDYDRIEFSLKRKLIEKPGDKFIYDGGNQEILGGIIKLKTGMYADSFASEYLFKPLNIINYDWNTFKQNHYPCMGGSLKLLPRDMAKIGQMVLNKGKFGGNQIVSSKWINESTSPKIQTNIDDNNYSYLWWNISLESNNKQYNCIWANGLGSQFIYIFPELNVVIVTTGYNYENDSWAITRGISKYLYLLDNF